MNRWRKIGLLGRGSWAQKSISVISLTLLATAFFLTAAEAAFPPLPQISAGAAYTVAIKTDGTLWAWGLNSNGQLGDGSTTDQTAPVQESTHATNWAVVSAGVAHTVAIKSNGTLWAWGDNTYGQLGNGTTTANNVPVQENTLATDWVAVAAGAYYTVAIKSDGTLWAWGDNTYGQLGNGTTTASNIPVQESTLATNWSAVSAGSGHTVAIKSNGTLWAWGDNSSGQLGDGTITGQLSPEQICPAPGSATCPTTGWRDVAAGGSHTVALQTGNTLWAWGDNGVGELGDGTTNNQISPEQIGTDINWAAVSAHSNANTTLARKTDGTLWSWGYDVFGQLGYAAPQICIGPTSADCSMSPEQIGTGTNWGDIALGTFHAVALQTDNTLWAWGNNAYGELGDGTTTNQLAPEFIIPLAGALVNGGCGTANGGTFPTLTSTSNGLCSSGTVGNFLGSGPWTWDCNGSNGGTTANCSASVTPVNGACGTANGQTFTTLTSTSNGLCSSGTVGNFLGSGPWTWNCNGSNGGTTANCSASVTPVDGACGTANGGSFPTAPTTNLCSKGTATPVPPTLSGSQWTWSCNGSNGGATVNCSALAPVVNGACGTANGGTFATAPATNLCSAGTPTPVGSNGGLWTWSCTGLNGGSNDDTCAALISSPVNGACGSANGQSLSSAPTTNLCNAGTATAVSGSGPWTWSCNGVNNGTNASCSASVSTTPVNGACGSANGQSLSSAPTTNLCSTGTATAVSGSGPWTWSCTGLNGGAAASCSASKAAPIPVNGVCGTASGGTFSTAPATGLCSAGTATPVPPTLSGSQWLWRCNGLNGGSNASCSANLEQNTFTVTPSVSPAAGGSISPDTPQPVAFNGSSSFTVTPNLGYFASVTGTGCRVTGSGHTYTAGPVTENCTVSVTFEPVQGGHKISGTVKSAAGVPLAGVTVTLSGDVAGTTNTDANGFYKFKPLTDGNYTVAVSKPGFTFTKTSKTAPVSGANVTKNFAGSPVYISGRVTNSSGNPMPNVSMTLTGDSIPLPMVVLTDINGNYKFKRLPDGGYTITPSKTGESFNPQNETVEVVNGESKSDENFTGSKTTSAPN
jgi:alpha-tubulin suppressor-like RCC1 family protein